MTYDNEKSNFLNISYFLPYLRVLINTFINDSLYLPFLIANFHERSRNKQGEMEKGRTNLIVFLRALDILPEYIGTIP